MSDKEIVLTQEGLAKLELELDDLKTVHRKEVNDRIRQAKEFGDISENAEYEDAKQEQAFVEGRIMRLEQMIRNARIIDVSGSTAEEVQLGATVKVKDVRQRRELRVLDRRFGRVGSAEQAAFQRVAARRRADRPAEGRDGRRGDPARQGSVQDRSRQQGDEESSGRQEDFLSEADLVAARRANLADLRSLGIDRSRRSDTRLPPAPSICTSATRRWEPKSSPPSRTTSRAGSCRFAAPGRRSSPTWSTARERCRSTSARTRSARNASPRSGRSIEAI